MARTDLESLVVQLSADFKSFEKSLARANDVSNRQFNAIERRARQMNKNLDGIFTRSFSGLTAPLAGLGAALGVDQLRKMTDTWTDMTSRVNLAAGSIDKGTEVMGRLGEMARRTYSDLSQTAESYLSNATALRELGYNTDESLNYTEALNNALVVSGAKGDRAARVIDALAKAMALGKLQGDNLNTVIDSGGRAAEALAAGLGTTVGGLRKLGAEGKITGQDIVRGLSSQMEKLRQEAADMPATIGDGFTLLNNALLQYVGNADSAAGVSAKISEALVMIADNFDKVADNGLRLAGVIAGALVGRSLLGMIHTLGLGITALGQLRKALAAAQTMGGLATAFGGLGAAAGPVGMIIGGAVVSSLILYNNTVGKASEASEVYAAALKEVQDAAKDTGDAVEEAGGKVARGLPEKLEGGIAFSLEEIAQATQTVIDQFDNLRNVSFEGVPQDEVDKVRLLGEQFRSGAITAQKLASELDGITRANPAWESFTSSVELFVGKLVEAEKAARLLQARLADTRADMGRSAKDDVVRVDLNAISAANYEKEALRKASLNKKEHALEMERIRVRNDAIKDGTKLTEEAIDRIAKANLAAQESRTAEGKKPKKEKKTPADKFDTTVQDANDRTAALVAETEALRQINPLIDDYGFAAEKARTEQELLNAAQKAGIAITPELRSQIAQTAQQWALATAEANKLNEAQGELRQKSQEWRSTELDAFKGLVTDLSSGKDAVEALTDAVQKLIDKLLDMTLNNLFDGLFGKSGSLFGGFMGFKDGGLPKFANGTPSRPGPGLIRGRGTGRSDSILARVSNREFITNARSTAKYRGLLEAINKDNLPAFANGTPSLRAPSMPTLQTPQRTSAAVPMRVDVVTRFENDGNFHSYVENVSQSTSSRTVKAYDKSGPMRFARDSKQANRRGLVR
ncbi:tape measure protein [Brucella pseudogrignonensis]|uniref:Tape measure domain-containing protein n=1 Tax=Brucella pseudogrignonensis TaxID=419475 RepID=A0ABU1M4L5_9HYPH|nr:tape measure protein [Brucella pseudogrignonensis]MDR6431005.1 tape measure domain-containing protein [Brucella pseudogrignonensis]